VALSRTKPENDREGFREGMFSARLVMAGLIWHAKVKRWMEWYGIDDDQSKKMRVLLISWFGWCFPVLRLSKGTLPCSPWPRYVRRKWWRKKRHAQNRWFVFVSVLISSGCSTLLPRRHSKKSVPVCARLLDFPFPVVFRSRSGHQLLSICWQPEGGC